VHKVRRNHKDLCSNKQDSTQEFQELPQNSSNNQSPRLDMGGGVPPELIMVGRVKTVTAELP
jgi:hypothetical protein